MARPRAAARWRATAWATLLALLAALLLPSLARATAGGASTAWAEVCTAQGSKLVPVAADGEGGVSLHGAWDHCPWCLKLEAAPPPAQAGRPEPWAKAAGQPPAAAEPPVARHAPRALPPPRGPPAHARG